MGGGFCLIYPVTADSLEALARFPQIAKAIELPTGGSELEIVRLLRNTHYSHLDRLLAFIDRELAGSGEIGARAVKQTDPFHLNESLAELFLFTHFRKRLGSAARPAVFPKNAVGPEIEVTQPESTVKIEVYSPLDLAGYQLVTDHVRSLFKYIDVHRGFRLEVAIDPVDNSVESVWYPYTLPAGDDAVRWLHGVRASAQTFLGGTNLRPGDILDLAGPGGSTTLTVNVQEVFDDPAVRLVSFTSGSRSTDARLLFECGTPEYTAGSGWGQKLKTKMRKRQAGPPTPGVLRVLVLNFSQADTGWPDFYAWPEIAMRLDKTVRLLSAELTSGLPYDLVLPARLDLDCDFGVPIWLDAALTEPGTEFLRSAGLRGEPRPRSRIEPIAGELAEFIEDDR